MKVGERGFLISTQTKEVASAALATVHTDNPKRQQNPIRLTRNEIAKLRVKAIRRGVWFRALRKAERAYIELTIRILDGVHSSLLTRVLTPILQRLRNALESKVAHIEKNVGLPLAQKLSRIAQAWGNISAIYWAKDPVFTRYLSIMYINAA